VNVDCAGPDDEAALAALRSWFDLAQATAAYGFMVRIAAQPPLSGEFFQTGGNYGPGNSVWGELEYRALNRHRRPRWVRRPYSDSEYTRFKSEAAELLLFRGEVRIARLLVALLGESGRYLMRDYQVEVTASLPAASANTLLLAMDFPPRRLDPDVVAAWRAWVDEHEVTFGVIDRAVGDVETVLEKCLPDLGYSLMPQVRRLLRGYGWLTIASPEVGERLGGVDALRGTGAFAEVARTRSGSYWLQATTDPHAYGMAEAERVFRAVAPVLPPGMPDIPRSWEWEEELPYLIVTEDASTIKTPGHRG
jgi:hypothetical protein